MLSKSIKKIIPYRPFHRVIDETLKIPERCWPLLYFNFTRVLQFSSTSHAYNMVTMCFCVKLINNEVDAAFQEDFLSIY